MTSNKVPEFVIGVKNQMAAVFEPVGFVVEVSKEAHEWRIGVVEYHEEYGDKTELYGLGIDNVLASAYDYHRGAL